MTFQVAYGEMDSTVYVPLPAEWVAANAELLAADDFAEQFHGLALRPTGEGAGNAVFGFRSTGSALRVRTTSDTTNYAVLKLHTAIEADPAAAPEGHLLLQDDVRSFLELQFVSLDTLGTSPLNRAALRLDVDTTLLETPGFARPIAPTLVLYGEIDDQRTELDRAAYSATTGGYTFSGGGILGLFQAQLVEDLTFDRLLVSVPTDPTTLNVAPLYGPGAADPALRPRAIFVVAPSAD